MSEKELEAVVEPKKKRGADTKRLLSFARRAVDDYGMIEDGDVIAVGVSGGKDSLALLSAMAGLRRFYPKCFSIIAVSIDMGLEGMDFSGVAEYCRSLDVEYKIVSTEISKVIFDVRKESNPCLQARQNTRLTRESSRFAMQLHGS